ncbi:VCBS repeat-containing protein [Candidatus Saccharibacteria bacterium]|nr:VCBS repeat-containing protein [Candidatus Saccharibacteria bacterium]
MQKLNQRYKLLVILAGLGWFATSGSLAFAYPLQLHTNYNDPANGDKHLQELVDIDLDGRLDLVVSTGEYPGFTVSYGNGDGSFQPPIGFESSGYSVGIDTGDLNGDGYPDVAVVDANVFMVSVFINDGSGGFLPAVNYSAPGSGGNKITSSRVEIAELDGMGGLDLAVTSINQDIYYLFSNPLADGVLSTPISFYTQKMPIDIKSGDFDQDGDNDLVYSNSGSSTVSVDINNGSGVFTNSLSFSMPKSMPVDLTVGDYNNDGYPDFAVSDIANQVLYVYTNLANGNFSPQTVMAGSSLYQLASGDLDGDGWIDIVGAGSSTDQLQVYINNQAGGFNSPSDNYPMTGAFGVALGDINGDCTLDTTTAGHSPEVNVYLGAAAPGLLVVGNPCGADYLTEVSEQGPTAQSVSFVLSGSPNQPVIVNCSIDQPGQVDIGDSLMSFTLSPKDPYRPMTIDFTAIDDLEIDGDQVVHINCVTSSGDPDFDGLVMGAEIRVIDNDGEETPVDPPVNNPTPEGDSKVSSLAPAGLRLLKVFSVLGFGSAISVSLLKIYSRRSDASDATISFDDLH